MSLSRFFTVFWLDLKFNLKRPLFWFLVVMVGLMALLMSTGNLRIQSGDSEVGGKKVWITSEFALAQTVSAVVFLFFSFFAAVGAGMAVVRDEELKIGEIVHATPLRPGEYVWAKFAAVLLAFIASLVAYLAITAFCYHVVPNADAAKFHGPFDPVAYFRAAVAFGLPTLVFIAGTSFAVGERTRKPILVFVLPVVALLFCGFFLWSWTPSWLDPGVNRFLMLVDPAGIRWLSETWLKVDKGVDFYNHARIPFDSGFVWSRLAFGAIGIAAVAWSHFRFASTLRGHVSSRQARRMLSQRLVPPTQVREPAALGVLAMKSSVIGFLQQTIDVARFELRGLMRQPGLYLFVPLILLEMLEIAWEESKAAGSFGTPMLLTPGLYSVLCVAPLTYMVCMLLTFYTVESLERERTTGLGPIYYSTPVRTGAVLSGKALANSIVGVAILAACLLGGAILVLLQGRVAFSLTPFAITWGLLLVPTFLLWTSAVTLLYAIGGNRYIAYALAAGVLGMTLYFSLRGKLDWTTNWGLFGALQWSDIGAYQLDRTAIVLNRLAALALAVFFIALTLRIFRRREVDSARMVDAFRPRELRRTALRLLPWFGVPVVVWIALAATVRAGFEGSAAKLRAKEYWQKNLATWKDAPLPATTFADVDLVLDPERRWFHVKGTYDLVDRDHDTIARFPVTTGDHFENVKWTLDGKDVTPEDRRKLFVFTPSTPLHPGDSTKLGFEYDGVFPKGVTDKGHGTMEFVLPSGVVIGSFGPTFVPIVGYLEQVGIENENKYEPKVYPDDFYEGITMPAFGNVEPFRTRMRITGPDAYTYNGVGVLKSEETKDGKRTVVWESDYPVNFFNVVAGKWDVRRGNGTAIYYHPGHPYNVDEMIEALDGARKYYSEWFHPFPWPELKLSEFPANATYAQGFPTNITFSEGIGFLTRSDPKVRIAFFVTAHESAHQWWGNLICPGKGPGGDLLSEGTSHFSTMMLLEQMRGLQARIEFCKRIEERYGERRQVDSEKPMVKIDGSRDGDETVTYDKAGWVYWMLQQLMGREANLKGIQAFFQKYVGNPDHPVLQDFVATMRPFAPDADAYDAFVKQWFFDVVVPEYWLNDAKKTKTTVDGKDEWTVTLTVENGGTGRMPVAVAAIKGDRFKDQTEAEAAKGPAEPNPDYRESRTTITLGAGEKQTVTLHCDFDPEKVIMDPDAVVLQLKRKFAYAKL
jgi:ABC-2 type transport system permease protein